MIKRAGRERAIFRKGSTTYYFSSQFFPRKVREDVFKLYSFVRVADDYVDALPPNPKAFSDLRRLWETSRAHTGFDASVRHGEATNIRVIKNIVQLSRQYGFEDRWIAAFLDAMQADLDKAAYLTIEDTIGYMFGSAEVVGLMMAKIMGLPPAAFEAAKLQGRAMQFINFLRDIEEDNGLGRTYLPAQDLQRFGLKDLRESTARMQPDNFVALMRYELDRYTAWQAEAEEGFRYIPRRLRVPLQTAVDMYNWTAGVIAKDPFIVFDRKVKPRKRRVITRAVINGSQFFVLDI